MPLTVPTTDDLKGIALDDFRSHFPDAEIRECLPPDKVNRHCDLNLIGVAFPIVSTQDLTGPEAMRIGANELVEFEFTRETCPNAEVQVRGTVRLNVDRHRDGQLPKARRAFQFLAQQIREIGTAGLLLIEREPDGSQGLLDVLKLALLARVKIPADERIETDGHGVAWLVNTRLKVREVVAWSVDKGWSVWKIHQHYDGKVPLPALHAAFTYFDNHREEILTELREDDRYAAEMREKLGQPPAVQRLLSNRK